MKKQVFVSVDPWETRVAMLEAVGKPTQGGSSRGGNGSKVDSGEAPYRVAEIYLERRGGRSIVGNIYKGKVANVLGGLEAAFVDIGLGKNGFLHVDEIVMPGVETQRRGHGGKGSRQIGDLLKIGQEIVVQVVKDPLKTKGARLSMDLTIPGRYMVFTPTGEGVGVSRRLDDRERERLRRETRKLDLRGGGAIVRTAAYGAKRIDFERELLYLHKLNEVLNSRIEQASAPALVFQEADLAIRVMRDIASDELEQVLVDDDQQHHRLVSFLERTAPELVDRVELYQDDVPLFERYGIEAEIDGTLSRRVDLPSGGYLVIDYAEALTVIDVNTGSFTGKGRSARLEDTIAQTNLEAASEVVRQLRLRDIGGIIVIDFIDMAKARNKDQVLRTLRKELERDRTKTYVVEISPLGLVEMTRQNVTEGVREVMTRRCLVCNGDGVIRSEETLAIEIERKLREIAKERSAKAFLARVHPKIKAQFVGEGGPMLGQLEQDTERFFYFEGSEGLMLDHFEIVFEGTAEEVAERALPFREGDEVLVQIVEPHMYNERDAVAKLDGYIVTVKEGVDRIGEQHLVKIESVDRAEAVATVVGASPAASGTDKGRRATAGRRKPPSSTQTASLTKEQDPVKSSSHVSETATGQAGDGSQSDG